MADPISFQSRVARWMIECFGDAASYDITERGDRFLEEALELLQALGYDHTRVATLRDYVWSRPEGDPPQEVGGVLITLAGLCMAAKVDMHAAGDAELDRVWTKIAQIRAKQAAKRDLHSPLPGTAPAESAAPTILRSAADAIAQRAQLRDCPKGERSMGRCVAAFNAITGHQLTEVEGWHFMELLKLARATAGGHHLDDHTDRAAYAALAGEAAERRQVPA